MKRENNNEQAAPLTLDGAAILHQMFRVRRAQWNTADHSERTDALRRAALTIEEMERNEAGQSALFSLIGHKSDLMLVHFRRDFHELNEVELKLGGLKLWSYLEPAMSYVSAVELGLYEASVRLYRSLEEKGVEAHSAQWKEAIGNEMARQREKMGERLWPKAPARHYVCFYPMNKRRGEAKNWYRLPIDERRRLMLDHGMVGRRFAGEVTQIISGSTGLDDWEWGVDLFADDPLIFKKLIYEMRFDEASAAYAEFGPFYLGIRRSPAELGKLMGAPGGV